MAEFIITSEVEVIEPGSQPVEVIEVQHLVVEEIEFQTVEVIEADRTITEVIEGTAPAEVFEAEWTVMEMFTTGMQGPPGPPGVPGPSGGAILVRVGATPLSGHSAVTCGPDGLLIPADSTVYSHLGAVLGVVVNAYSPGDDAEVKTGFPLEHNGWTWSPGPVYVGTGGQLTQSMPPGAVFCQVVGHALSATLILVDLQPPIAIS